REAREVIARGQAIADDAADDLVRLAERNALPGQMVGEVGGREHPALRRATHRLAIEPQSAYESGEGLERRCRSGGVVERHALLLQVAVVRERQALQRREQRDEVADDAAGP